MHALLTLALRCKRDVVLARQRARQIAALLHFEFQDQACIAAGAFAVATEALRQARSGEVCMETDGKVLHLFARRLQPRDPAGAVPPGSLRLVKSLPLAASRDFSAEDVAWVVEQLNQQECLNLFEEMDHQNQEMLALLHALHAAQGHGGQRQPAPSTSSAA